MPPNTARLQAWGRCHPVLDGAVFGPLVGLVLLAWRWIGWVSISSAAILGAAVVATGVGVLMGVRRRRRLAAGGLERPSRLQS